GAADALGLPAALPARGHAGAAAHGDEENTLNAAVALVTRQAGDGKTGDRAVLLLGVVADVGVDPVEDFPHLNERIGLVTDDLGDFLLDVRRENDVRRALVQASAIPVRR